ncbi:hypothetical protein E2C01_062455 [Portunus trituberculatus]|uniref:Uncharacterized protein n=1 Tax=Portunus trituberculatus TaxID=210409 RepID=A0A5B7HG47_PORTR|nr:hypothetical protein [Portunus trituberculatus]
MTVRRKQMISRGSFVKSLFSSSLPLRLLLKL